MKLQGIRLLVEKFDETFSFYADSLELEVTWGKPGESYASFKIGGQIGISIFTAELMDKAIGVPAIEVRRCADTAVIVIDTNELDVLYRKLTAKGVTFVTEPHDMPGWGNRCAHLRDPEGNLIELSTMLLEEKWEDELREAAKGYNR
jgi:predicted enzyme related to lactoylglutathione lyase